MTERPRSYIPSSQERFEKSLSKEPDPSKRVKRIKQRFESLKTDIQYDWAIGFAAIGSVISSIPLTILEAIPRWGSLSMSIGGTFFSIGSYIAHQENKADQQKLAHLQRAEEFSSRVDSANDPILTDVIYQFPEVRKSTDDLLRVKDILDYLREQGHIKTADTKD